MSEQAPLLEFIQAIKDGGHAHATEFAQLLHRHRFLELGQRLANFFQRWRLLPTGRTRGMRQDRQSQGRAGLGQLQRDMPAGRGRTVLSAQQQLVGPTPEVKIGVAPAVEFTGTSEGLARSACVGAFAGVMNQQDGQLKLALKLPQVRQERGHLRGVVFIQPVEPDQRVQDQQDGLELLDGVRQTLAVGWRVKPQAG